MGGYYFRSVRFRKFPTSRQVALESCIKRQFGTCWCTQKQRVGSWTLLTGSQLINPARFIACHFVEKPFCFFAMLIKRRPPSSCLGVLTVGQNIFLLHVETVRRFLPLSVLRGNRTFSSFLYRNPVPQCEWRWQSRCGMSPTVGFASGGHQMTYVFDIHLSLFAHQ